MRQKLHLVKWGVFSVEQVDDPWHAEAFAGTPAEGLGRTGERRKMWYGVDHCQNLTVEIGPVVPGQRVEFADGDFWLTDEGGDDERK